MRAAHSYCSQDQKTVKLALYASIMHRQMIGYMDIQVKEGSGFVALENVLGVATGL